MKKILFTLLLFTGFLHAQTYPVNPTKFGKISLNTNTESTTATKINVQEDSNEVNWMRPTDIPVNISPQPTNYTIPDTKLGSHLKGIDNRLGQIGNTTAGITNRIYFTGVPTTITAGTFYTSSATGKGAVAGVLQTVSNDDNVKNYFGQDVVSIAQPSATTAPPGNYSGQLSVMVDNNAAQERFTIEIYKTNNAGTPIASGIDEAPVGNLGVTVVAILDSGVLDLVASSVSNVSVSGNLKSTLSLAAGERLRYHVSSQKVGTAGNAFMFSLFYGSDYNSYYDVTVTPTTDGVINKSTVTGVTATDAFNSLDTDKENISNKAIDFTTVNNTLYPTVQATKTYADNLVVGLLNDRGSYDASTNLYPSNGGSGIGGIILKGNIWSITVSGVLGGVNVGVGDWIRALANAPGQTSSNWAVVEGNFGYVPANDANVIHKTTNETWTGIKSSVNTGNSQINGLDLTNDGMSGTQVLFLTNNQTGAGGFFRNLFSGQGLSGDNANIGTLVNLNSRTASTGNLLRFTKNNVSVTTFDGNAILNTPPFFITTTPMTSGVGFYDFLTRNTSSGLVEKLPLANVQSAVVTNAAIDTAKPNIALSTNTVNLTGDQTFTGIKSTTNSGTGASQVNGLTLVNSSNSLNSDVLNVTNTDLGKGIRVTNTGTGTGLRIDNSGSAGIVAINTSATTGDGISVTNNSIGQGLRITNSLSGKAIRIDNLSSGNAIEITNSTGQSGKGIVINGNGSGDFITVNGQTAATGKIFTGQNNGVNTYTLDKTGKIISSGTVTASPATVDTELATLGQVRAIRPYKVYSATLNQVSTGAPTTTIFENTVGAIVWTRITAGMYWGTLTGAFPVAKTHLSITPSSPTGSYSIYRNTDDIIVVQTKDTSLFPFVDSDDKLFNNSIEIRVYNFVFLLLPYSMIRRRKTKLKQLK